MIISIFAFTFFVVTRILLDSLWEQYSVYYSYSYEALFIVVTFWLLRKKNINFKFKFTTSLLIKSVLMFLLGVATLKLATHSGFTIPFDLSNKEVIFLLLIIGPILEELIFRFALWEWFDNFVKNQEIQIWMSTFLFSISHFMAIFMISPDLRPFVLLQSFYVIVLGTVLSKVRQESNSFLPSILVHFAFNLGFLIGNF